MKEARLLYLSFIDVFETGISVGVQSILSKVVEPDEFGKVTTHFLNFTQSWYCFFTFRRKIPTILERMNKDLSLSGKCRSVRSLAKAL